MKSKKTQLMRKADRLWFNALIKPVCEVCGQRANQVHHFFPKGSYGHLRYDLDNGIAICMSCHFKHHTKFMPVIHQEIIRKRGQKWYDDLEARSKQRLSSFATVGYYKEKIEFLSSLKN